MGMLEKALCDFEMLSFVDEQVKAKVFDIFNRSSI